MLHGVNGRSGLYHVASIIKTNSNQDRFSAHFFPVFLFNQNQNFMNAVDILALLIGLQNLFENRTQSAQNDVNAANEREARYLLDELGKRLDAQDAMLSKILDLLDGRV